MQPIKDILETLEEDIQMTTQLEQPLLARSEQIIKLIQQSIQNIREQMASYSFKDDEEEIFFFKALLPEFYARLIYHLHVFHVEAKRPKASVKIQKRILRNELKRIAMFFQKHAPFVEYYNAGNTYLDDKYFTRDAASDAMPFLLDDYSLVLDTICCTTYSFVLSKIKAFEQVQHYIIRELNNLEKKSDGIQDDALKPEKWKLGPFALVELGYLIHLTGGLPGTLKSTMDFLEKCFDTRIGNYSRMLQQMRIRKEERAAYLTKGIDLFYRHMDELDDKLS